MKWSSPRFLTALVLAGFATWLIAWAPFWTDAPLERCYLELTAVEPFTGEMLVSVDEGHGYSLEIMRSFPRPHQPGAQLALLPVGRVRALQVLCSGAPELKLTSAVLRLARGGLLASIAPANWQAGEGTVALRTADVTTFSGAKPGQGFGFELVPPQPLYIPSGREPSLLEVTGWFLLLLGGFYALAFWFPSSWKEALGARFAAIWQRAKSRPLLTLTAVALASVLLNVYPLLFAGRSLVSPNHYVPLLYAHQPTLPGAALEPQEDPKGADLGAMMWQTQPYSALASRMFLRDWEGPWWNRYSANGVSFLAQHLSMAADPLNLLFLPAHGAGWSWDLRFELARLLFALGIGFCAWRVTGSLGPSALITASAPWIGFFAYRFIHPAIFSVSYAPWVLLPWLAAASARTRRELWLWGLALMAADWAELNSGTGKESSMLLLWMNLGGVLTLLCAQRPWRERAVRSAAMLGASGLFLLVSAPCWLLFADALRHAFTIYDVPHAYQLQPSLALGFFDEIFIQDFSKNGYHTTPSLNFLALAGVLWFLACGRSWKFNWTAGVLALVSLPVVALVFGVIPPSWIVRVPLIGNIQHIHNTFGCVLLVWGLVLAAVGVQRATAWTEPLAGWSTWLRMLITLAGLALAYFTFTQVVPQPPYSLFDVRPYLHGRFFIAYAPALLLAAAALPWALRAASRPGRWRGAGWAVVGVSFFVVHFRHGLHLETKFDDQVMNPKAGAELEPNTPALARVRAELARRGEPARVVGFENVFMPGCNVLFELEGICGAEPLINPYYRELYTAAGLHHEWGWRLLVEEETLPRLKPIYDFLGVRYYFRDPAMRAVPLPGLHPLGQDDLDLYESAEAWPRAFFTDHCLSYENAAQFAELVRRGDGRPFAAVQGALPTESRARYPQRRIVPGRDYRLTPNITEFSITAPGPGVVVLGESFEEGNFRATLNGAPASYFRVNHSFKGMVLPAAGEYRLQFSYWPRLLTPALWLSAIGLTMTLGLSVWMLRGDATLSTTSPRSPSAPDHAAPDRHGDRAVAQNLP